ncbi:hypothetical protein CPC08DRAFT_768227 [Agrocybe pediades]|nr:hypothetical protein CPC08DRAFT_768227 [Agrocybe pediades]
MSTTDEFPFSVAQQKALISADLNSTLLFQFLFGIYTGIFLATMYIYSHKENRTRARDMIIIGNTGALYFLIALGAVMNWIFTNVLYCTKGATRVDMFIESLMQNMPLREEIINNVTSLVVYLFADGLLVSGVEMLSRMWSVLSQIITANPATHSGDSAIVYRCLVDAKSDFNTFQTTENSNRLSAAANIAVVLTSLFSTGIICLQIWQHSSPSSRSRKHYKAIINALIQSSAIYTVAVLLEAIVDFTNTGDAQSSFTIISISGFIDVASQIASGLAPTLMIARLVLSSSEQDTVVSSAHLPSELISGAPHATGTANMTNVGADLEMQQRSSFGVDEQESEAIQVGLAPTLMIAALVVSSSHDSGSQVSSDLISGASDAKTENIESDFEMQRSGSLPMGERESEEIQVVPGDDHGLDNDGEARLKTIA